VIEEAKAENVVPMGLPEYGSAEWLALRDDMLHIWIQDTHAVNFIKIIGDAAELWDDLIDQDKPILKNDVNNVFVALTTVLPLNPFFDAYKTQLIPIMITGINTWHDATALEKGSDNDKAIAYVLRDWYVELVMYVVYLARGYDAMRDVSAGARKFFGQHESLQDYMEKLS